MPMGRPPKYKELHALNEKVIANLAAHHVQLKHGNTAHAQKHLAALAELNKLIKAEEKRIKDEKKPQPKKPAQKGEMRDVIDIQSQYMGERELYVKAMIKGDTTAIKELRPIIAHLYQELMAARAAEKAKYANKGQRN